jgi:hypothetical protein
MAFPRFCAFILVLIGGATRLIRFYDAIPALGIRRT